MYPATVIYRFQWNLVLNTSLCTSKYGAPYLPVTKISCKHSSFPNTSENNTNSLEQNPPSEFNSNSGNQEIRVASDMLNTVNRRACLAIPYWASYVYLISNFRRVLNVVWFLLGNSPASEFRRRGITQKKAVKSSLPPRFLFLYDTVSAFTSACKLICPLLTLPVKFCLYFCSFLSTSTY